MIYWRIILKLYYAMTPLWSIVEWTKNESLMVVLLKYIILKKIKISVQRPVKLTRVENFRK